MGVTTSALPQYAGSSTVGAYDVELVLDKPKSFGTTMIPSPKTGSLVPAFTMDSVLFTLFYPCEKPRSRFPTKPYWLDRPLSHVTTGWLKFANRLPSRKPYTYFLLALTWIIGSRIRLPAYEAARLARDEGGKGKKLQLVIFSHGLAGNRKIYSQYCGELASRGFVVAALEHRDGSSPSTTVHNRDGCELRTIQYIAHSDVQWRTGPKLTPIQARAEQLEMRKAEVAETLKAIQHLVAAQSIPDNVRSKLQSQFDWTPWHGAVDASNNVIMTGHSFGSATAIECVRDADLIRVFSKCILLDPWVDPLGAGVADSGTHTSSENGTQASVDIATKDASSSIRLPVLVQNSAAFTRWTEHFERVFKLVREVRSPQMTYFVTLAGTVHSSFSDFHLLVPSWLTRWQNRRAKPVERKDAVRDMNQIVNASLEFLGCQSTGILDTPIEKYNSQPPGQVIVHYRSP